MSEDQSVVDTSSDEGALVKGPQANEEMTSDEESVSQKKGDGKSGGRTPKPIPMDPMWPLYSNQDPSSWTTLSRKEQYEDNRAMRKDRKGKGRVVMPAGWEDVSNGKNAWLWATMTSDEQKSEKIKFQRAERAAAGAKRGRPSNEKDKAPRKERRGSSSTTVGDDSNADEIEAEEGDKSGIIILGEAAAHEADGEKNVRHSSNPSENAGRSRESTTRLHPKNLKKKRNRLMREIADLNADMELARPSGGHRERLMLVYITNCKETNKNGGRRKREDCLDVPMAIVVSESKETTREMCKSILDTIDTPGEGGPVTLDQLSCSAEVNEYHERARADRSKALASLKAYHPSEVVVTEVGTVVMGHA
jgi:hypothetical protein